MYRYNYRQCKTIPNLRSIRSNRLKIYDCKYLFASSLHIIHFRQPELIKALYAMGFHQPSKIQEAALPILLLEP